MHREYTTIEEGNGARSRRWHREYTPIEMGEKQYRVQASKQLDAGAESKLQE